MRIDSAIATEPVFEPEKSQRHFSITASDYVMRVFMKDVLAYVHREAPSITFEFRQSSVHVQAELESGEVDFVIGPEIDVLSEHPQQHLFDDTYTLIAWAGSTVVGDTVTFDEYLALKHVVFRTQREGMPWLERWFEKRYGELRRIEVAAPNFTLLPHLVVGTDRVATVQTRLAQEYARVLPIKLIPPPLELPKLVEVMQWHIHRDQDPASQWLRKVLVEHAKKMPEP